MITGRGVFVGVAVGGRGVGVHVGVGVTVGVLVGVAVYVGVFVTVGGGPCVGVADGATAAVAAVALLVPPREVTPKTIGPVLKGAPAGMWKSR